VGATATTDRFGTANMAMSFDGSTDYIEIQDLGLTGAATLSFWFNAVRTSNEDRLLSNIDNTKNSSGNQFSLRFNSNKIQIWSSFWANISDVISAGSWYNFVIVFSNLGGSAAATAYLDGQASGLSSTQTFRFWKIGVGSKFFYFGGGPAGTNFKGTIDEVKIFNRALTAAEILAMYNHEKGKFSVGKDGTLSAVEFVEDPALPVQMRSKKQSLTVKGQLIEQ